MNIFKALRNGLNLVIENYKMAPIIYVVNLAGSLLLALPFVRALGKEISLKGVRDDLTMGFNFDWWSSLHASKDGLLETLRPSIDGGFTPIFDNLELLLTGDFTQYTVFVFVLGLTYIFLAAFFNGGSLALWADEKRSYSTGRFFSLSGFYFHHFFALALTSVLLFLLVYKFIHPAIFHIVDAITASSMSETFVWWINLAGYLIFAVLFVFIKVVFDYAKIILVVQNHESSWYCIWLALKFVVMHPVKTIGLLVLLMCCSLGLILIVGGLLQLMNPTGLFVLLLLVILQQVFMVLKIGIRLLSLSSQLVLFQQHKPVSMPVKKKLKTKVKK